MKKKHFISEFFCFGLLLKTELYSRYSFVFFTNQIFYKVARWFYWIFNIKLRFVYFKQRKTYHANVFVLKLLISVTKLLLYDLKRKRIFFNWIVKISCHVTIVQAQTNATWNNLNRNESEILKPLSVIWTKNCSNSR